MVKIPETHVMVFVCQIYNSVDFIHNSKPVSLKSQLEAWLAQNPTITVVSTDQTTFSKMDGGKMTPHVIYTILYTKEEDE